MGELARNLFLFKSFSLTMAATHIMRIVSQDTTPGMIKLALPFVLMHVVAGAAAMQVKNVIYGKNLQKMDDAKFWLQAFAQGGGLGIYGDMLNSAFARTGSSPVATLAGPIGGGDWSEVTEILVMGPSSEVAELARREERLLF